LVTADLINGQASCIWTNIPYGKHNLTAEDAGDSNYENSIGNITGYDVKKKMQDVLTITGVPKSIV
jgi:hypothetical protein